jgi:hypothetical protein
MAKEQLQNYKCPKTDSLAKCESQILSLAMRASQSMPSEESRKAYLNIEACMALLRALPPQSAVIASNLYRSLCHKTQTAITYSQFTAHLNVYCDTINAEIREKGETPKVGSVSDEQARSQMPTQVATYAVNALYTHDDDDAHDDDYAHDDVLYDENYADDEEQSDDIYADDEERYADIYAHDEEQSDADDAHDEEQSDEDVHAHSEDEQEDEQGAHYEEDQDDIFGATSWQDDSDSENQEDSQESVDGFVYCPPNETRKYIPKRVFCSLCGCTDHVASQGCPYMVGPHGYVANVEPMHYFCNVCPSDVNPRLKHPPSLCPYRRGGIWNGQSGNSGF